MKAGAALLREIVGLFVDDEGLAAAIVAVVALALALAFGLRAPAVVTAAALTLGSVAALAGSVLKRRG